MKLFRKKEPQPAKAKSLVLYTSEIIHAALQVRSAAMAGPELQKKLINEVYYDLIQLVNEMRREHG